MKNDRTHTPPSWTEERLVWPGTPTDTSKQQPRQADDNTTSCNSELADSRNEEAKTDTATTLSTPTTSVYATSGPTTRPKWSDPSPDWSTRSQDHRD